MVLLLLHMHAAEDIIASVPEDRHEDLIFVQNGALLPEPHVHVSRL